MKILLIHNRYQHPGGEDEVLQAEKELLSASGHVVKEYIRDNREIAGYGIWDKATLALRTTWAWDTCGELRKLLAQEKCALVHFHNTFPLISPAAYEACREAGVPVVQSLHNPRLLCPAATFYRDGRVCEDCLGKTPPWPSVLHACYRGSRIQTGVVASMLTIHRWLGTWHKQIDTYIVFTEFYRRKFIDGGLPAEKIVVKPHFVNSDGGVRKAAGSYALFIGRLAPEKGVHTLLRTWKRVNNIPLKIRGDGPLLEKVKDSVRQVCNNMEILPRISSYALASLIRESRFLIWPSEGYYETFGRVAVEAFAAGVPVIASGLGVMAEIVEDGRTGLHFTPGDPDDLAVKVEWAWTHPERMEEMGRNARTEYEAKYTAERNYQMLMDIYQRAIAAHRAN